MRNMKLSDTEFFYILLRRAKLNQTDCAGNLGLSVTAFHNRLRGRLSFTHEEMNKLSGLIKRRIDQFSSSNKSESTLQPSF